MHLLFTSPVTSTNRDPSETFTMRPYVKSVLVKSMLYLTECTTYHLVNLLAPEFYIEILAHSVCKM
jgi:hypothetical protein